MKNYYIILLILASIIALAACTKKSNVNMEVPMNTSTLDPIFTNSVSPTNTATPTLMSTPIPTVTAVVSETDYTGKKLVALTFDDGPNTDTTPLILDKLQQYNVVASFFLIGQNINEYTKTVMERQLQLGCEVNNHSWSHPYMNKLSIDEIRKEVEDTSKQIYETVGIRPAFFRPPFIATNEDMFLNIMLPFICGIGCTDWDPTVSADQRAETIISNVKDGDIILLHDSSGNFNTVAALDQIIPTLLEKDYAFVTVSELFELKGIDPNTMNKMWTNLND